MKNAILAVTLAAAMGGFGDAVPVVSEATMVQPSGTREVTITYTLSDAAAIVTLDVQTNATDGTWASIGGENVQFVTGDVWKKVEVGDHTITWRPDLAWPGHKIAEGGARAVVTAWSVDNPPDYMVVDLSTSGGAGTERYYPAVEFLPGGILGNKDYRQGKLVMRKVSAKGVTWQMGSAPTEAGRIAGREDLHEVTLASNYYIGVFPVTGAQWALVQTARPMPSWFNVAREMRPAECVCYNEIRNNDGLSTTADTNYDWPNDPNPGSFLGLLRAKTGLDFDLPSEAQWEFACRAGQGSGVWNDGSPILSGTDDANLNRLGRYVWNGGFVQGEDADGKTTYTSPSKNMGTATGPENGTAVVGSYAPNAWGLYDMHGNVAEWCLDWFESDNTAYGGAVNVDPENPANTLSGDVGMNRVVRNGGWDYYAADCRTAFRVANNPQTQAWHNGLRLVLPLPSAAN